MSYYNNNRYTPGSKSNLRKFLNNQLIIDQYTNIISKEPNYKEYMANFENAIEANYLCQCRQLNKANDLKQGYNDPSISEASRISQRIQQSNLGGKITFGNLYKPVTLNYMGGWEGQPGGSQKPLRNKF